MIQCIEDTGIPVCMTGLLYALPNTQLTRRLLKEGRSASQPRSLSERRRCRPVHVGLELPDAAPRSEVLADYRAVLEHVYAPADYFARVCRVARQLDCSKKRFKMPLRYVLRDARSFLRMAWKMGVTNPATRIQFWWTFADGLLRNPRGLRYTGAMVALYLHLAVRPLHHEQAHRRDRRQRQARPRRSEDLRI
jgi:hypothetical protein